jgi:hypothetical protein
MQNQVVTETKEDHLPDHIGCSACTLLTECGGLPGDGELWGCFTKCHGCDTKKCMWTCLVKGKERMFVERWREVGGWPPAPLKKLLSPPELTLPFYIPMIHDGRHRVNPLNETFLAVPTFKAVRGRKDGSYGMSGFGPEAFRNDFQLRPDSQALLVSVAPDRYLERYWRDGEYFKVAEALSMAGLLAVTAPNYSFFSDVPRTHSLWNRTRICRAAEMLSESTVATILHIHADTNADWHFWATIIANQAEIKYVCVEFQTGAALPKVGLELIDNLSRLQQIAGRQLHIIAVGGARHLEQLVKTFEHLTIIDSNPFFKTMKRRRLVNRSNSRPIWTKAHTPLGHPLDSLLQDNISTYRLWLDTRRKNALNGGDIRDFELTQPKHPHTALAPDQVLFNFLTRKAA